LDDSMLDVFCSLVRDIAERVTTSNEHPSWNAVRTAVRDWQRLLDRATPMTPERQLGLWGELKLIESSSDCDAAVATWQGATRSPADFVGGGVAIECKTSRSSHVHWVSISQVGRPIGDYETYFVSLSAVDDPIHGRSLPDLVREIATRMSDPDMLWTKLLQYGYSPKDRDAYSVRISLREEPRCLWERDVPRVHNIDARVLEVRYRVDLREVEVRASLSEILGRLLGQGGRHEASDTLGQHASARLA